MSMKCICMYMSYLETANARYATICKNDAEKLSWSKANVQDMVETDKVKLWLKRILS